MIKTHTLFRDVDESILKLNEFIKTDGYFFEKIDLAQLEQIAAAILRVKKNQGRKLRFQDGTIVSDEFYRAYSRSNICNHVIKDNNDPEYYIILTKDEVIEDVENNELLTKRLNEVKDYSFVLLRKLHLLKNSSIEYVTTVQHDYEKNHLRSMIGNADPPRYFILRFKIEEEDLDLAKRLLKNDLFEDSNFQLSLDSFELAYRTNNIHLCFLNLVTSLESIFNRGISPISHTVARHLSLILSDNKEDFTEKYKEIKKMYDLRSKIVHGASKQDYQTVSSSFVKLRDYSLRALQFVNGKRLNKEQLFDYLNSYGFEDK